MDDPGGSSTYRLLLIVLLLALSALFSGAETAFFSLSQLRLRQLQEKGIKKAALLQRLLDDGQRFLSTLLVGNTAVNIWLTSLITTLLLNRLGGSHGAQLASLFATIVSTLLLLIFGEVTPKALATSAPESLALFASKPIAMTHRLLRPIVSLLHFVTGIGNGSNAAHAPSITEDTIKTALTMGEAAGSLQQENREMIYGIFASDDTPIERIMVPRAKMVAVPSDLSMQQAISVFLEAGYSRLPVYQDDFDHILGLVYAKDLLPLLRGDLTGPVKDVMRPVMRCRPTRKLNNLLQEMRVKCMHLCIVTSGQGKTLGLVTMEDLLEEIVGEIIDEYDDEPPLALPAKEVSPC